MPPQKTPLDQGVNIGTEPSTLLPGELLTARNCHYETETATLLKLKGRVTFGNVTSAALTGLGFVSFKSGGKHLIASAGNQYSTAALTLDPTSTWVNRRILTNTAGDMEAVYFNSTDRVYLSDANNRMQVWDGQTTMRNAGLLSPNVDLTLTIIANAATRYTQGTTYSYVYTEFDAGTGVESGPSEVANVQLTAAGDTIKITAPYMFNCESTQYRIYRTQDGGGVFFRIADLDIGFTTYYDGDNSEGAAADRIDNDQIWGFKTVTDQFLSTQPVLPMLGSPIKANYVSQNGEIPKGDIVISYQNHHIVSGVRDFPQHVYYSLPDEPEQFSPVYFLNEENPRGDPVTGLGVANDRLIAFTLNSIYRHDKVPLITDPNFGLGLASRQEVSANQGCVAKRTVVNYGVGDNINNRLFYLSSRGPFSTDGYTVIPLGEDLNWDVSNVNFNELSRAVAVNYPKYNQIRLFVPSPASSINDIMYIYHYHPKHKKRYTGVGKWAGPTPIRCSASTVAFNKATETRLFIADSNASGDVFTEDTGLKDEQLNENAAGDINWEWETGDFDFGTESRNKRYERIYVNHRGTNTFKPTFQYATNQSDSLHAINLANTTRNKEEKASLGASGVPKVKARTSRGGIWKTGTHLRLRMQETAQEERGISTIEVEVSPFGGQR